MAPDKLTVKGVEHLVDGELTFVCCNLSVKQHLEDEVSKFLAQIIPVLTVNRIDDLVDLFNRVLADGRERLFPVPRAAAFRSQPSHQANRLFKEATVAFGFGAVGKAWARETSWLYFRRWASTDEWWARRLAGGDPLYFVSMPPADLILLIFALLLGLIFGSFLNVCVVRLAQGDSIVSPRSHCMACGHPIRARDNIPVASWLLLRGRCRDCGARISVRYLLVEIGSAVLFAVCLLRFGAGLHAIAMAAFCWLLLGLLLMDAKTFLLPDAFTIPGIALGFIYTTATASNALPGLVEALAGAAAIAAFLFLVGLLYRLVRKREGMGFGDVKLGAMLGAWLGWQMGAVSLFLAIVAGAAGGVLIVASQEKGADDEAGSVGALRVPFGSFLAGAGILTVFAGPRLLHWYMSFFPR